MSVDIAVTARSPAGQRAGRGGANSQHHGIMAVIGLAALAGLGRASQARSFARLAAWDKRRNPSGQRVPKTRQA
jgi:hypothetical protein